MTQLFTTCLGLVAPYYNLVLVIIVILLFIKLFSLKNQKSYLKPWKLLFFAILVYVLEEILTVLKMAGIIIIPRITNAFFEMVIISLFIYMVLSQKEYVKKPVKKLSKNEKLPKEGLGKPKVSQKVLGKSKTSQKK